MIKDINYFKEGNCDLFCWMFSWNYVKFVIFYRINLGYINFENKEDLCIKVWNFF